MMVVPMRRFAIAFFLFAIAVFAVPLAIAKTADIFLGLIVGIGGAVAWLIGISIALNRYGPRAFWLSLTAPAGLFWLLFVARWFYGASQGDPHWMMP
jgi:hypothetical protein